MNLIQVTPWRFKLLKENHDRRNVNERPGYTEGNESVRRLSEGHTEIFPITLRRLASIFEGKFEDVSIVNL